MTQNYPLAASSWTRFSLSQKLFTTLVLFQEVINLVKNDGFSVFTVPGGKPRESKFSVAESCGVRPSRGNFHYSLWHMSACFPLGVLGAVGYQCTMDTC